ncbi:cytochrome P450 93A3 [Glycine max]|uniref:cytochrome P450 93A3 n=1 Tax=Glycine max TaxID=3847 RepID=UPI00023D17AB|nr:cytochrome P450 93A3 [Glycine max]|eukprot:XP_006593257.1 cytochrome P450 93A3 [Glycine max]
MEKARKEIDSIIGKDIMVLETDIDNIPSLQAIVKETLRLHPPSPFVLRESTRNCTIAGYDIPAKTQVFTNVWAIGRDPKYWDGPLEFRPKRFLSNDNESGKMGQVGFRGQHYQLLLLGVEEKGVLELH